MSLKLPIYMDYNATTPVDQRVVDAMLPYFTEYYGNAASTDHEFGNFALKAVSSAREQIASLINARSDDIIFTSGATESDNIALFGIAEKYASKGDHIITCVTEHKAVLDVAKRLEQMGKQVTYLPVDQYGLVDPDEVRKAITPGTVLISIMAANNEIGTIPALKEIGTIAREHGVLFHTDAAQYVGHLPLDVNELKIDLLSISAHKMYGPKGVGALYVRRNDPWVNIAPVIYGGGHEQGVRSGTLNVPAIVGFGVAAQLCIAEMEVEEKRLRDLMQQMFAEISEGVAGVELNGHPTQRLPHNLNISIKGIKSKAFMVALKDIAISAGSACTTASVEPSHVICALGFGDDRAHSSLRFSIGRFTIEDELKYVIIKVAKLAEKLLTKVGYDMLTNNYLFAATCGKQGGHEYYVLQCPIKLLSKIILFNEPELPKNIRLERLVDDPQVELIIKYLIEKIDSYLLPPLLVTVNQPVVFEESNSFGKGLGIGRLLIPMSALIALNFGQNYRAALIEVLRQHPEIANDTIPIMLFVDENFLNTPQIFSSLNLKTDSNLRKRSIQEAEGNQLTHLVKELVEEVTLFAGLTEMEKTTLSHRSSKLFTLSSIYQANQALLGSTKRTKLTAHHKELAIKYWDALTQTIPEWGQAVRREVRTSELRRNYVHAHGMTLISLGNLGHKLLEQYPDEWQNRLKILKDVDWKRTNVEWQKRAMSHGRMSKARHSIVLTTNYLKTLLDLSLTPEEEKCEAELIN